MYLKDSLSIMLTGEANSGKTHQIEQVFNLFVETPDGEVIYPFRPALFLATGGDRFSAAGTASEMAQHPDCKFIRAGTVDEAIATLREEVTRADQAGRPYRMVVHDSWSSFRDQAAQEVRDRAVNEASGGKGLGGQARKNVANNWKDIHSLALGDIGSLVNAFFECGAARPRLMISTCHTEERDPAVEPLKPPGQTLRVSKTIQHKIHAGANIVWHMIRSSPDVSRYALGDPRAEELLKNPERFAVTTPGNYPAPIGNLWFPKVQGDHGSLEVFAKLTPPVLRDPNLANQLQIVLMHQHGLLMHQS